MKKSLLVFILLANGLFLNNSIVEAETKSNIFKPTRIMVNQDTLDRGLTIVSSNKKFKVGINGGVISAGDNTRITLNKVKKKDYNLKGQKLVSNLYVFDIFNKQSTSVNDSIWLSIKYKNKKNIKGKKIIKFYNGTTGKWKKLPSQKKKRKKIVQASINLPYAVVGVFNKKIKKPKKKKKKKKKDEVVGESQVGYASWYDYHGAASTKYPYGSIVKVTNLNNNVSTKVEIVDYGPFIEGRVIDLPRQAFAEIADLGAGVVKVKVEPIYIP